MLRVVEDLVLEEGGGSECAVTLGGCVDASGPLLYGGGGYFNIFIFPTCSTYFSTTIGCLREAEL